MAMIRPGKPAPLPRSTKLDANGGMSGANCAESQTCRRHTSARDARETRLWRALQSISSPTKTFSRTSVSRETPVARANASGPKSGGKAFSGSGLRTDMGEHQSQCGRRNAIDPGRLPQRGGTDRLQLLPGLRRKPLDRQVLQVCRNPQPL